MTEQKPTTEEFSFVLSMRLPHYENLSSAFSAVPGAGRIALLMEAAPINGREDESRAESVRTPEARHFQRGIYTDHGNIIFRPDVVLPGRVVCRVTYTSHTYFEKIHNVLESLEAAQADATSVAALVGASLSDMPEDS